MKMYVPSPSVLYIRIHLNSRAYDLCERKFNGGSVGLNVEKLHDLGRYSKKYRPTVHLNFFVEPDIRNFGSHRTQSARFCSICY
jgi:hypothetical protein